MPAKKKKASDMKALAEVLEDALKIVLRELVDRKEKLAAAEQSVERALASAQRRDDENLTAIRKLVDAKLKDNAANQAEIEYWMGEVNRLHYELIDIRREAARDGVS